MRSLVVGVVLVVFVARSSDGQTHEILCADGWGHSVVMVDVGDGVVLETLDWGGAGPPMVFLAGLGDTGHIFDRFALNFSPEYRVIAITRRGYGASSHAEAGYTADIRARDILRVMDNYEIDRAVFVGHSIAGDELSYLGANHGDRIDRLVYLDAYAYGTISELWRGTPDDFFPSNLERTHRDSLSAGHLSAYQARRNYDVPLSEVCSKFEFDSAGRFVGWRGASGASNKVLEGVHSVSFNQIDAPVLGVFADNPVRDMLDRIETMPHERRAELRHSGRKWRQYFTEQLVRFEEEIPNSRLAVLEGADHHVWWSHPAETVALMLEFLED